MFKFSKKLVRKFCYGKLKLLNVKIIHIAVTETTLCQCWMRERLRNINEIKMTEQEKSLRENYPPVPLFTPQIPHGLSWGRLRAAAMRS